MKVLDTDTCIALLRGNDEVVARRSTTSDDVATTWLNAGELYFGAAKSKAPDKNRALVRSFLATLPVLALDEVSVQIFGEAKAMLERKGVKVADAAAIVTSRAQNYERIPGVLVENWAA